MSNKKSLCIIVALVLFMGIFAFPQSTTADTPTTLIREYQLPAIPLTTIAYLGPARTPFDVEYALTGHAWITDIARDTIYRLSPATALNQTLTNASQWVLPGTPGAAIKRSPAYIIVDESQKVVWFTNPTSCQISRFNWSTNQLDDWDLANLNIFPLDLVMKSSNDIWFTGLNDSRFFELKANTVFSYTIFGMGMTGGQIPVAKPTRITLNATCLFLTDFLHDKLYELPFPVLKALNFPLTHPGFSWDVDVDSANNVWVTQPLSSLIDEQLVHSVNKSYYRVNSTSVSIGPETHFLQPTPLNVTVQIAPVTPSAYPGPLNITGDPYTVWSIPTGVGAVVTMVPPPARPWDVASSADGYAWFTEPFYNHVGVVQPNTNRTLLYAVPTGQSLPLSMDIQPGNPSNSYHVWFTEYRSGQIGELFNASYTTTTPGAPLVITIPGIAVGFVAGAVAMGVIFVVARRSRGATRKSK